MKKQKIFFGYLFFLFFLSQGTFSQVKIYGCGINLVIPEFKENRIPVREDTVLIQKGVLVPIEESTAEIEIRMFSLPFGQRRTRVIKCSNSKFSIDDYEVNDRLNNKPIVLEPYMTNLGAYSNNPKYDILLIHKTINTEKKNFIDFFKTLIENRFFNGPTDKEVKEIINKKHPNLVPDSFDTGSGFVQVKIGKHLKFFTKNLGDYSKALDIIEYKEKHNINQSLKKLN